MDEVLAQGTLHRNFEHSLRHQQGCEHHQFMNEYEHPLLDNENLRRRHTHISSLHISPFRSTSRLGRFRHTSRGTPFYLVIQVKRRREGPAEYGGRGRIGIIPMKNSNLDNSGNYKPPTLSKVYRRFHLYYCCAVICM